MVGGRLVLGDPRYSFIREVSLRGATDEGAVVRAIVKVNASVITYLVVPEPKVAVIVSCFTPTRSGVPEIVAVPLSLPVNRRPFGNLPLFVIEGDGVPTAVTTNEKGEFRVAVTMFELVKPLVGITTASTAPMSHGVGRFIPSWSGVEHNVALLTAEIAGLPGCKAMVRVLPPLSCKDPSSGSTPDWL
jgi:hypothetical protein